MAQRIETDRVDLARLDEKVVSLDRLMEAKFVTFRAYVDAEAGRVALALAAADKAVTKAEDATERRFESVNEFRAQLSDQAGSFVTRDSFQAGMATIAARMSTLEKAIERHEGRGAGLAAGWGYLVTAAGLALTVVTLVIIFTR